MNTSINLLGELHQTTFSHQSDPYQLAQATHPGGVQLFANALDELLGENATEKSLEDFRQRIKESQTEMHDARVARVVFKKAYLSSRDSRRETTPRAKCWRHESLQIENDRPPNIEDVFIYPHYNLELLEAPGGNIYLLAPGKFLVGERWESELSSRFFAETTPCGTDLVVLLASKIEQVTAVCECLKGKEAQLCVIISSRALANDVDLPQDTTHEFAVHKIATYLKGDKKKMMTLDKIGEGVNSLVVRLSNSGAAVFHAPQKATPTSENSSAPDDDNHQKEGDANVRGTLIFDGKRPVSLKEPGIGRIEGYGYLYLLAFAMEWASKERSNNHLDFIEDAVERANLCCNIQFLNGVGIGADNRDLDLEKWLPHMPLVTSARQADKLHDAFRKFNENGDIKGATRFSDLHLPHSDVVQSQVKIAIPEAEVLAPEIFWRGTSLGTLCPSGWLAGAKTNLENDIIIHSSRPDGLADEMEKLALQILGPDEAAKADSLEARLKQSRSDFRPACVGGLNLADRQEIEDYLFLQNLLIDYECAPSEDKPISIGVFGPPGSGKSFGIKQLVKGLNDSGANFQKEELEFNLSQLQNPTELAAALHKVRNACLADGIPLVFFDEFDSALHGTPFFWLKYFLAPMQDGNFLADGNRYMLGKAIFVFAGGINQSFSEMNGRSRNADFCQSKGPDFLSRLRGVLNIRGINLSSNLEDIGMHMVKRAILLRYWLGERRKGSAPGSKQRLMEDKLAKAFLRIPSFRHGIRSMEAIVKMSHITSGQPYKPADLPPSGQLDIHVDARSFLNLLRLPDSPPKGEAQDSQV